MSLPEWTKELKAGDKVILQYLPRKDWNDKIEAVDAIRQDGNIAIGDLIFTKEDHHYDQYFPDIYSFHLKLTPYTWDAERKIRGLDKIPLPFIEGPLFKEGLFYKRKQLTNRIDVCSCPLSLILYNHQLNDGKGGINFWLSYSDVILHSKSSPFTNQPT